MQIREYKPSDCKYIAKLFYDTVHTINAKDYTDEQLNVWATGVVDLDAWNQSFLEHYTIVAVKNKVIVGFGDIATTGYLDRLYVHKDHQRKGIASVICKELEQVFEVDTVTTQASITAKPFFENRGYRVVKSQNIERNGIFLTNYLMEKNCCHAILT